VLLIEIVQRHGGSPLEDREVDVGTYIGPEHGTAFPVTVPLIGGAAPALKQACPEEHRHNEDAGNPFQHGQYDSG